MLKIYPQKRKMNVTNLPVSGVFSRLAIIVAQKRVKGINKRTCSKVVNLRTLDNWAAFCSSEAGKP